jgi:hypothetical protein
MFSRALSRLFSFPAMLMTGLLVSPFIASLDVQQGGPVMRDPDIWWHLRNAEVLISTHHFIRQDLYSFTVHGQPWINPEWLAELPYYFGYRALGELGIFLVMLLAIELVIAGVFLLCYRRSGDPKAAFLATWIAVLFAAINIGPRTILFGWLCFLAEMLLLESFRRNRDRLWLLPLLFALWINLHGSWLIGLAFFFVFIASGLIQGSWGSIEAVRWTPLQLRKLIAVAVLSVAALFVNPYGWRLIASPFDMIFQQQLNIAVVDEWHSIDFQGFQGKMVFVVLTGMFVLTLARRRPWPLHELLFALLALYEALAHRRFLFLAGMVICPMMGVELIGSVFEPYESKRNRPLLNALFMAGYLLFGVWRIPSSAKLHAAEPQYFPVAALPELEHCCTQGHLLNAYEWGGFLIWNARDIPVFLDSRADIFDHHGVLADFVRATSMQDSLAILDQYHVDYVLLPPASSLIYLLKHTSGWRVQFEDSTSALLVRDAR